MYKAASTQVLKSNLLVVLLINEVLNLDLEVW
jgi:hypothetical protein